MPNEITIDRSAVTVSGAALPSVVTASDLVPATPAESYAAPPAAGADDAALAEPEEPDEHPATATDASSAPPRITALWETDKRVIVDIGPPGLRGVG